MTPLDPPASEMLGSTCSTLDELAFHVQMWNCQGTAVQGLVAAANSRRAAFAAFYASVEEFPQNCIVLTEGTQLLARSQGMARSTKTPPDAAPERAGGAGSQVQAMLTVRERQVVALLSRGMPMKAVARSLRLTERTVAYHKYHVMQVNGLRSTADLIEFARCNGLVQSISEEATSGE